MNQHRIAVILVVCCEQCQCHDTESQEFQCRDIGILYVYLAWPRPRISGAALSFVKPVATVFKAGNSSTTALTRKPSFLVKYLVVINI